LDSFGWPLIEEVHADIFSSLDGYAHASFVEVVQVGNLDAMKSVFGFEIAKPMKSWTSRGKYEPAEQDIIVVSAQKPVHVSDLTQNKESFVLGSVLKSEVEDEFPPNWCVVRLSSVIPVEIDPETKKPKGQLFLVFLLNMKTYNRIHKCLCLGGNTTGPVNIVWQFKPTSVRWSYARRVSNVPCLCWHIRLPNISIYVLEL
jgi:hypothetical protein